MQFIKDIYRAKGAAGKPVISFEFFPPKTPEGDRALMEKTIPALMKLAPDYSSMTYGAGGTTREKTLSTVEQIQKQHGLTTMAHVTCVDATREQVEEVLREAHQRGIHNILALRGDPPGGGGEFKVVEGGFEFAFQLVRFIREQGDFCIGTAGFPEGHIACKEGKLVDWDRLKAKIDAGADFVITQLFFDNQDYFEFRDHMTKELGTTVPLCPGIIPILSANQIQRFTAMCGSRIPDPLKARLEVIGDDSQAASDFGIEYATQQCEGLLREGAPGIHFYTLNKARSTTAIVNNLGLGPETP